MIVSHWSISILGLFRFKTTSYLLRLVTFPSSEYSYSTLNPQSESDTATSDSCSKRETSRVWWCNIPSPVPGRVRPVSRASIPIGSHIPRRWLPLWAEIRGFSVWLWLWTRPPRPQQHSQHEGSWCVSGSILERATPCVCVCGLIGWDKTLFSIDRAKLND